MSGSRPQPTEAEQLQARVRQQEQVAGFGLRALATRDLDALPAEAAALLADTLGVELTKVLQLTREGSGLLVRAGVGWREGTVGNVAVPAGPDTWAGFTLRSS